MYERILVAIDGGQSTRSTLETACALADRYDAKLGILYVTKPKEISDDLIREAEIEGVISAPAYSGSIDRFAYYQTSKEVQDMHRANSVARLAVEIGNGVVSEAEAFSRKKNVKAIKTFVRTGDVVDAIVDVATEADADLIVMGHERRTLMGSLIHRSVAEAVDDKANCPCLVLSQ